MSALPKSAVDNRIWFDTEFLENGHTIDLISIGMVRADGATFYAETFGAERLASSDDWLRDHVRPHLKGGDAILYRERMAAAIREFAGPKPELWAYYADYDWVVLCQLFGRMIDLPDGWPMYCRDLKQSLDEAGAGKPPKQTEGEHNALADALWTRDAWLWLQAQHPSPTDTRDAGRDLRDPSASVTRSHGEG